MSKIGNKSERLSFSGWTGAFRSRSHAEENDTYGWCVGSLQYHNDTESVCPHCQQDTSNFTYKSGLEKGQLTLHTRVYIPKGLYLIHVGAVNGEGNWFKLGSAQKMTDRLCDHLRKQSHEYCRVLYLKGHSGNSKTVEGIEGLINGRLREEYSERLDEEYFRYTEGAIQRCKELMDNPWLLEDDLLDKAS